MEQPIATAPVFVPPHTVLGGEMTLALAYAHIFMDARQATLDAQANARAWQALNLRKANNCETVDHNTDTNTNTADQAGQTENQQDETQAQSTLSAEDVAKVAGAVAASQVPNNANTEQAAALINALASMYKLDVTVAPAGK